MIISNYISLSVNVIGHKFGRLTVLEQHKGKNSHKICKCHCDCGNIVVCRKVHLLTGAQKSCGCLKVERFTKHGLHKTPEYDTWRNMNQRCSRPTHKDYHRYGGRGITVCERWKQFENFYADMGIRPSAFHSIERIDNNLGYTPDNCKWATTTEQAINKRKPEHNTSGVKGVSWSKKHRKWVAYIGIHGKRILLGYFCKMEEAISARQAGEEKYWPKSI